MKYQTLRANCPAWNDYVTHDFVEQLRSGTLPNDSFLHYLKQDYLFLLQFTRIYAVAIYKSQTLEQMRAGQSGINSMLDTEINLHVQYCAKWGINEIEMQKTPESSANIAYTRYVLDAGMSGTLADLHTALAPCMMGYGEIGKRLGDAPKVDGNPYQSWIDLYASAEYQNACTESEAFLDHLLADVSDEHAVALQRTFDTATRMESAFWQMGLDRS